MAPETEYNETAGSAFADTIIRTFFGYEPDASGELPAAIGGALSGTLRNVRWGDQLLDIVVRRGETTISPAST